MNHRRTATVAALALVGALSAGAAQARDNDIHWSVSIGAPIGFIFQAQRPLIVAPAPYHYRGPQGPGWRQAGYAPRWDRDDDGIPNRHDRVYNPRWDRDGDGIPNRRDRRPDDPRHGRGHGHGGDPGGWRGR